MMTKSSARLAQWITRYAENPIEDVRRIPAVRNEVKVARAKKVAKKKRKMSAAQKAGLAKARKTLLARYGTTDISKIKKKSPRRGVAKSRRKTKRPSAELEANRRAPKRREEEEEMALEENPRKRRRRKKGGKKRRRTRARAENPRRRRKASKRRSHKRRRAENPRRRRRSHKRRARAENPRRRRRSHKRRVHHRRRRAENPRRRRVHRRRAANPRRRRRSHSRRRTYRRRENPGFAPNPGSGIVPAGMSGSAYGGLLSNPMGPYSARSLTAYGWAAGGIGLGLVVADFVDRYVATRKPSDTKGGSKGLNPWYGRDAAAAMARRPDGVRLGAQALGGVGALGLAYVARHNRVLPWMLGGVALGFGGNLFMKLISWWVMPRILEVKAGEEGKPSLANRLYPLEQKTVQDAVAGMFEAWDGVASLAAGQQQTPTIASPLSDTPSSDVYTLGAAGQDGAPPLSGAAGQQGLNDQSGRVGACQSCGGMPGHYANCPELCPDCPGGSGVPGTDEGGGGGRGNESGGGGGGGSCTWVVREGDDLLAIVNEAGVNVNDVSSMNGGGDPSTYWYAGNAVTLPRAACMVILRNGGGQPRIPQGGGGGTTTTTRIPTSTLTTRTAQQPGTPALPRQPVSTSTRTVAPSPAPNVQLSGAEREQKSMNFVADETEDE